MQVLYLGGGESHLLPVCRKLLYDLYENLTDDDLNKMKFLSNKLLPRRKLWKSSVSVAGGAKDRSSSRMLAVALGVTVADSASLFLCWTFQSALEVFVEMEQTGLISHTKLHTLKDIIQKVCPMLVDKINKFEADYSKLRNIICYFQTTSTTGTTTTTTNNKGNNIINNNNIIIKKQK